jgi:hypothetical protein
MDVLEQNHFIFTGAAYEVPSRIFTRTRIASRALPINFHTGCARRAGRHRALLAALRRLSRRDGTGKHGRRSAGAAPIAFVIALGILVALTLILRHSARASVLTGILMAPAFWLLGLGNSSIWIAAAAGLVISFRFLIDWNRQYRELWLDREQPPN